MLFDQLPFDELLTGEQPAGRRDDVVQEYVRPNPNG
jgi:hypothetical protein